MRALAAFRRPLPLIPFAHSLAQAGDHPIKHEPGMILKKKCEIGGWRHV